MQCLQRLRELRPIDAKGALAIAPITSYSGGTLIAQR